MNMKRKAVIGLLTITLIMTLAFVVVRGFKVYKSIYKEDPYKNLDRITAEDILNKEGEYYVYFQKETCKYCDNIKNDILKLSKRKKVYVVDTEDEKNQEIESYDWDLHYKNNMIEIGRYDSKGNITFYGEYTYSNLKSFFPEADYSIHKADDEFIKQYKNGVKGYVYAVLEKPLINYENISPKTMIVPGVPFLIRVKDKAIVDYYCGDTAIIKLIGSKTEPLSPYIE